MGEDDLAAIADKAFPPSSVQEVQDESRSIPLARIPEKVELTRLMSISREATCLSWDAVCGLQDIGKTIWGILKVAEACCFLNEGRVDVAYYCSPHI